jgi:hypothetical protein
MRNLTKRLNTFWFDHRTDLPQWVAIGIAQNVAEWSALERELEEIIRILVDGQIEHVRIMTNRMPVRTRNATIKHLIESHILHGRLGRKDLKRFTKLAKQTEAHQTTRDLLAHGLWSKFGKSWFVLQVRQARAIPALSPTLESLSRTTLPGRQKITRAKLRSTCVRTVALAKRVEGFGRHIERLLATLAPLRNTPPKYTRRRPDYRPEPKHKVP